jgi:hypothetical protein
MLRSRLYSATSRPALGGASVIRRDRLTTEERLSDIVEILGARSALAWMRFLSTCACTLAVAVHLLTSLHGASEANDSAAGRSACGAQPDVPRLSSRVRI